MTWSEEKGLLLRRIDDLEKACLAALALVREREAEAEAEAEAFEDEIDDWRAERDELEAALRKYGRHGAVGAPCSGPCAEWVEGTAGCTCGLDAVLNQWPEPGSDDGIGS